MELHALQELTGSFEDFKELVPKAGDRLKLKKYLREEFVGTSRIEGSYDVSAVVSSDSYCDIEQLSPVQSINKPSTMCKFMLATY